MRAHINHLFLGKIIVRKAISNEVVLLIFLEITVGARLFLR